MKATWMLVVATAACGGGAKAVGGGGAPAKGGEPVDVGPVRADLDVYTDGKGHYIPLVEPDPEREIPTELALFYGDGKAFHAADVGQFYADGMKFEIGFSDPRLSSSASIERELGKVRLKCYGEELELTRLPDAEAQAMVGAASFYKNETKFRPLALAKNGDKYLYVDIDASDREKHRVFSGTKGKMKAIPVKSSKYDERENTFTFETEQGTLVATRDRDAREYAFGLGWAGKKEPWETLGRGESWRLIFEELGIYPSRTPTPCDPVMP